MVLSLIILYVIFFSLGIYFFYKIKEINNNINKIKNELIILIQKTNTDLFIKTNRENLLNINNIIEEKFKKIKLEKIKELTNTILEKSKIESNNNKKIIFNELVKLETSLKNNIHKEHKKLLVEELKTFKKDMDGNLNNIVESVKNMKIF
tara:strand:- start:3201 stop:3650 length:450 start_codon:yes stop_codon:yes gene_type:complete